MDYFRSLGRNSGDKKKLAALENRIAALETMPGRLTALEDDSKELEVRKENKSLILQLRHFLFFFLVHAFSYDCFRRARRHLYCTRGVHFDTPSGCTRSLCTLYLYAHIY